MNHMQAAGWEKIKEVRIERFTDDGSPWVANSDQFVDYAHCVITTTDGSIYFYETEVGETEEQNEKMLTERGWTNSRCHLFQ